MKEKTFYRENIIALVACIADIGAEAGIEPGLHPIPPFCSVLSSQTEWS